MPKKETTKKNQSAKATSKKDAKKIQDEDVAVAAMEDFDMNEKKTFLTKEGLKKLQDELHYLKTDKRTELAAKLKEAIAYGDLSENSEYDEAKNEQAFVEVRIRELEEIIANAKIITSSHAGTVVELGCTVSVTNLTFKKDEKYTIVGSMEADPLNGMISNESPVGAALLGEAAGATVKVKAPKGVFEYKITKIE